MRLQIEDLSIPVSQCSSDPVIAETGKQEHRKTGVHTLTLPVVGRGGGDRWISFAVGIPALQQLCSKHCGQVWKKEFLRWVEVVKRSEWSGPR